ncbi:unnamed protein product [Toxocara canis]|uniref:GTP-binding protein n=1 Tax=Toxocara canis TaxID=6265 RepID=A0A183TXJ6_TOXCA|nr:unnamed protein product [Toxocara canis]
MEPLEGFSRCFQRARADSATELRSKTSDRAGPKRLERSSSTVRPTASRRESAHSTVPSVKPQQCTLIVLGASRVGKSALVGQFLWDAFISQYRPTVEEFNWIEYNNDFGNELLLQVIDTSGSHDFLAMRHLYARTGDGFIEIRERNIKKAPILLLGNKSDLYESEADWPCQEIRSFASAYLIPYAPISAKNSHRVRTTFNQHFSLEK